MTNSEVLNGIALCAGIGGLDVGADRALAGGLRCVGYVERESYSASALVARMDGKALDRAPVFDDLATFPSRAYHGRVDIVTAGIPCQPFSVAGKRAGTDHTSLMRGGMTKPSLRDIHKLLKENEI